MNEGSADWVEGPGLAESMWRHRRLVALVVALTTTAALGYALLLQPTRYEGVARVYLDAAMTKQSDDPSRVVRAQAEIIGSPSVLERAAESAGGGLTRQLLEERVSVEPASDADLITVRVLEGTPERAAQVADSVVLAYTDMLVEQAQSSATRAADELKAAEERLTVRLEALVDDLALEPENLALQAKVEARQNELEDIAEEVEATDLAATRADQDGPSVQASVVPDEPAQPRPLRTGALGAIAGLVLAALLAWWREGRSRLRPTPVPASGGAGAAGAGPAPAGTVAPGSAGSGSAPDGTPRPGPGSPVPRPASVPDGGPASAPDEGDLVRVVSGDDAPGGDADPTRRQILTRLKRLGDYTGDGAENEADVSRLTSSLQQVVDSLEDAPEGVYHPDAPQYVADEVAALPDVDEVVVLLDEGDGLHVSGRVGLGDGAAGERRRDDAALLDTLVEAGPHLVADGERTRLVRAGIPGSTAETVVCVPLLHDDSASVVLLAGRREGAGARPGAAAGEDDAQDDLARIARRAQQLVPHLRAWLLLRRMTQRLGTPDGTGQGSQA